MSKLIQLKKDGISERIKNPRTAPVIGTAAKIEEALAVPIDLAAKAVKYNPKIFGTKPWNIMFINTSLSYKDVSKKLKLLGKNKIHIGK